ncbi:MAG: hypothetical protein AAFY22_12375 [Pseudomonadota bacterium]
MKRINKRQFKFHADAASMPPTPAIRRADRERQALGEILSDRLVEKIVGLEDAAALLRAGGLIHPAGILSREAHRLRDLVKQ